MSIALSEDVKALVGGANFAPFWHPDGKHIVSWGNVGTDPGEFCNPHNVIVDEDDYVYVCDRENSRIQVFTAAGTFISQWRDIHKPTDIYFDAQEIAYVSEQRPSISVLEKNGNVLARFDSPSGHGLWVDSGGDIYLASVSGKSLTKYARKR